MELGRDLGADVLAAPNSDVEVSLSAGPTSSAGPMYDPDSEADLLTWDRALAHFVGVTFGDTTPPLWR